jgi:hypothetical protein
MRPKLNESFLENRYARADRRERRLHPLSEFPGAIMLALRAAVDPAVRCRDGEGRVQRASFRHAAGVAQDYQDGIFAGTNDVIETITGKPPVTLEEFVSKFTV